jgi:hypothetical protein
MEFLEPYWYVSLPAGFAACILFYLMRWKKPAPGNGLPFGFWQYVRYDIAQLFKGLGMYVILYFVWGALPELSRLGIAFTAGLPPMNTPFAVAIGFAAKKIFDYTLTKFAKIG